MARKSWTPNPAFKTRVAALARAVPAEAEKEITRALRENGEEASARIKRDAPVDDGALQMSVSWSFGDPPAGVMGAGDNPENQTIPRHLRISIFAGGKKAPHAHLVHNGTAERVRKDGRSTGVAPPQPFFWPNIRSLRRRFKSRITRRANVGLKKGAKT
jgi:hypothetical protein